jgi:ribosomal protein S14
MRRPSASLSGRWSRRSRRCSICDHPEAHVINVTLVRRSESFRTIAHRHQVSTDALKRHSRDHLPQLLLKASEALERSDAELLKAELEAEKADIQRLKARAEAEQDVRTALSACGRALSALELQAKVLQIITEAPTLELHLHPEWLQLQAVILGALEPHPDARSAVLAAIRGTGSAAEINGWDGS